MALPVRTATKKRTILKNRFHTPIEAVSLDITPYFPTVKKILEEKGSISYPALQAEAELTLREAMFIINFLVYKGVLRADPNQRYHFIWGDPDDICFFTRNYGKTPEPLPETPMS